MSCVLSPSIPTEPDRDASPADLARSLVLATLALFWRRALPRDDDCYRLLLDALRQTAPTLPAVAGDHWPDALLREHIVAALAALRDGDRPLARLTDTQHLSDAALLLICLVGSVEREHLVCVALAALQAPAREPRPTLHLCNALLRDVLGQPTPDAEATLRRPLHLGLLEHPGDLPMPLRTLRMDPRLWQLLCGGEPHWPGCEPLPTADVLPNAAQAALPGLAARLGHGLDAGPDDGLGGDAADCVLLRGGPGSGRAEAAGALAALLGRRGLLVDLAHWLAEPALRLGCALAGRLVALRAAPGPGEALALPRVQPRLPLVLLLGEQGSVAGARAVELVMPLPDPAERRALWLAALAGPASAGLHAPAKARGTGSAQARPRTGPPPAELLDTLASARLSAPVILRLGAEARTRAAQSEQDLALAHVAAARREQAAADLRLLAQPLGRDVAAEALVLPAAVAAGVEEVILRARRREILWQHLGPTLAATATPGVRALFVGESGTGKTLAAGHIATRLGAPLFRVDLSAVMNKYIGESEKNLAQLLDRAAAADVVLLFDEADGVFGRRTDGKDTGERYANMLTDFLLARIETHPGIVLLTTNSRERIDPAFTRRLDVILEFPLPGFDERLALWRSHLGARAPGDAACRFLAGNCELAGGQIRNAVLTAAAHGPADGAIPPAALYRGVLAEYHKQGRGEPAKLARWGAGITATATLEEAP
ncbi:ATP-binding protein [Thiohalocapsa sp.]|uniref:AAA family ATPase n=1 Tax=Thiohalocapsa sp. TaxID=2497641 RepID=UPI0025EE9728|nr:ATP-binding protein [Thiohalocapsa sp.]